MTHEIIIEEDGRVRFLYDDALIGLQEMLGPATITRASNVEPDASGSWTVDLNPLGIDFADGPYRQRADALAAERVFVNRILKADRLNLKLPLHARFVIKGLL